MAIALEIKLPKILRVIGAALGLLLFIKFTYGLSPTSIAEVIFAVLLILLGTSIRIMSAAETAELLEELDNED